MPVRSVILRLSSAAALSAALGFIQSSTAQSSQFTLDERAQWSSESTAPPGSDRWTIDEARRALAADNPGKARSILNDWLNINERSRNPLLPEAYLLRGDARLALDEEFNALYDYETVAKKYRESEHFPLALRRELDISRLYTHGLKLRSLGFRWADSSEIAEELLIRIQERLPSSALAEEAAVELADFYYRRRDMALARDAYDLYLQNFPKGPNRIHATERRIQTDIARFKGPRYSASGLINARLQIRDFVARFPADADRSGLNEAMTARIEESMAAQLFDTAQWYLKVSDEPSARFTLRRLLRDFPSTIAARRAQSILIDKDWLPPTTPTTPTPTTPPLSDTPILEHADPAATGEPTQSPAANPTEGAPQ